MTAGPSGRDGEEAVQVSGCVSLLFRERGT